MNTKLILFIFTAISLLAISVVFILIKCFIKNEEIKELILKCVSILTVLIHYSGLVVDYLSTGQAIADNSLIFAIYPCHILMWLVLISSFIKNKNNKVARLLLEFSSFGGIICGFIGLSFNVNFLENPNLKNYEILKGLLSHVTLILSGILLFDCCKVKVNMKSNMLSTLFGLSIFTIDGLFINTLFKKFNIPEVNAMYMLYSPFEKAPFINFFTIGISALLVMLIFTTIYETIFYKKEDRWYSNIKRKTSRN